MRTFVAAAFIVALAAPAIVNAQAFGGSVNVPMGQGVKVAFAAPARDVVVADPTVADLTMLDAGAAMLLGKKYGVTTVTAFDATGRTVFSRQVVVSPAENATVAVYRGALQSDYACGSTCAQVQSGAAAAGAAAPGAATP